MKSQVAVRKSSRVRRSWSSEQQENYRRLRLSLEEQGFTVRREELKRGYGWKVSSGVCRAHDKKLIFVDSRLAPQEQVAFLSTKVEELVGPNAAEASSIQ